MSATTTLISRPTASQISLVGKPWYSTAALVMTDATALLLSVALSVTVKALWQGTIQLHGYLHLWPFLFVFLGVYASIGLYSGVSVGAPEELRRATIASTVLFLCLAAVTVSLRGGQRSFTWTLFLAILLSVALIPLARECVRLLFARESWWGFPAVVFGAGPTAKAVVKALLDEPGLGLKPIAVLDDSDEWVQDLHGVPMLGGADLAPLLLVPNRPTYAVFAMPDVPHSELMSMVERYGVNFSHVLVVPELTDFASLWVQPKSLGGMLGLELRQQARGDQPIAKRLLDLGLCLLGCPFILPLCAFIAALIRMDSSGAVLYGQKRIGHRGKIFTAWKFRSMVSNADGILDRYLSGSPALRAEWERDHKLKNDPRVTRIGRFLRKTSLDELPQLFNVLTGDMSLVGPRPIVHQEIERYGASFELYTRVKGGLTGLWQVSGRNDTTYGQRVQLDTFYVRNWSVWLDLCILFRTIAVVLFRHGAY
jgi:Undecaprenyl-phosphate galactose phosphotransferase WbaP